MDQRSIGLMNHHARRYATTGQQEHLQFMAEMIAATDDAQERHTLRWWANEGFRDYAGNEQRLLALHAELDELARALGA